MLRGSELINNAPIHAISLEDLKLDQKNVRFLHIRRDLSDEDIQSEIWKEGDTRKLHGQILAAGGLYEEPIINSAYVVLEGNRRVVCLRRLNKQAHAGELQGIEASKFDRVDCKVIPTDSNSTDIDLFLAAVHVKGKKEWNTFNRAKHISNLHTIHNMSYDNIAKYLGMGKVTVIRAVDVYYATEEYGRAYPEDKSWFHKFTYFDEVYKKKDLKDFRSNDENLVKFGDWVNEEKFREVRDVRLLPKILADDVAFEVFERSNLAEAKKSLESRDPTINSPDFRRIKEVIGIIRSFSRKELITTMNDESRMELLRVLQQESDSLVKDLVLMKGQVNSEE